MLAILFLAIPAVYAVPASTFPYARSQDGATRFAPLYENGNMVASLSEASPSRIQDLPNAYIVAFKPETPEETIEAHTAFIQSAALKAKSAIQEGVNHMYSMNFKGYSGTFDDVTLSLIRSSPEVDFVERDQVVWASDIQRGAPWGLARISHREKLGFSTFQKYEFATHGGEGVDAYVIDTGINVDHVSFEGRAFWGHTVPKNDEDRDGNGHGTHCAGTIASKDYGVAKGAHVYAVKVLGSNGSGSMSDVVAGVSWAAKAAVSKAKAVRAEENKTGKKSNFKGSVANMSLGGGKSPSLDRAINGAVDSGLHLAVAAGNDNKDACNYSPAAAEKAITVGASTLQDARAYFSNWGTCVDVFAPGLNIKSTWNAGDHSVNTISGTSMASPHVAGLLAYLLSLYPHETFNPSFDSDFTPMASLASSPSNPSFGVMSIVKALVPSFLLPAEVSIIEETMVAPIPAPGITPEQLKKAIIKLSTRDALKDVGEGSPNLLVFNNATEAGLWWKSL